MPHPNIRLLVVTGFLGGYTTFSTFENDALTLWERGAADLVATLAQSSEGARSAVCCSPKSRKTSRASPRFLLSLPVEMPTPAARVSASGTWLLF
jgi:hypothetical protein